MPQDIILDKFVKYLNIREPLLIRDLQNEFPDNYQTKVEALQADFNRLRQHLINRLCFGFAVVHAAMDEIGKLTWWEEGLQTLANWDETLDSLEVLVELSDVEEQAFWQTTVEKKIQEESQIQIDKKKIKLKILFERALDYIVSVHADYGIIIGLNQRTLFSPSNDYFELLHNNEIKKIKTKEIIAGTFNEVDLINLFNQARFKNGMSFIHSPGHTIRIYIKKGKWHIYDPSYNHTNTNSMHKRFPNKSKFVEEIMRIQGTSLAIRIASFEENKLHSLPSLISNGLNPKTITGKIQGYGLYMIALYTPEALFSVLDLATQTHEGKVAVAEALAAANTKGLTALHNIANYSPADLSKALDLAAETQEGKITIPQALSSATTQGWTGLHAIAFNAPNDVSKALDIAAKTQSGKAAIAKALTCSTVSGMTGFCMITLYASRGLFKILEIAQQNPQNWSGIIAWVLKAENKNKWTGLHNVAFYATQTLLPYIELAAKSKEGLEAIAKTLVASTDYNWTGLHTVAMYAPNALSRYLELASLTPEGLTAISDAMIKQNNFGWTGLQMAAYYAPHCLHLLLNLAVQTQDGLTNIAKAISIQTIHEFNTDIDEKPDSLKIPPGFSGLQMIARFAPDCLDKLVELATKTDEGMLAIKQTKDIEIAEGVTCLDIIKASAPLAYEKICEPTPQTSPAKHRLYLLAAFAEDNNALDPEQPKKKQRIFFPK